MADVDLDNPNLDLILDRNPLGAQRFLNDIGHVPTLAMCNEAHRAAKLAAYSKHLSDALNDRIAEDIEGDAQAGDRFE